MRVAIVCEWLLGIGGAEREVLEVHRLFPDAPIFTSQYNPKKIDWFKDADVQTGWLQKLPGGLKKFLPVLRAWYFSHLDLSSYDLVVTVNFGAEAKAVKTGPKTTHICICNAPIHYYWSRHEAYLKDPGFPAGFNWLARLGLKLLVNPLRRWDYKAAQNPDYMLAISSHIQQEIKKYYGRDSQVLHPPVDMDRFKHLRPTKRRGFVVVGRQTPYKKIDLAVGACTRLQVPLTVIGDGPEHYNLKKRAGPTVKFLGELPDPEVPEYMAAAEGFIFPGLDDFGITPVEAMAAGTPVIAYKAGGALDYVVPGKTGKFFTKQTVDGLAEALRKFSAGHYSHAGIKKAAQDFSAESFRKNLSKFIETTINEESPSAAPAEPVD